MGQIEAAGDMVSGALLGRVMEPTAGEAHGDAHGGACLNCGATLTGPFCHECGQSAHVHRTLHSIGHDLLHGAFHFEGKIWHTLPLLIAKPGELTRRYIAGQRARFVSPLALFLFSVFVMFATIHAVEGEGEGLGNGGRPKVEATEVAKLDAELARARSDLAIAERGAKAGDADAAGDLAAARARVRSLEGARSTTALVSGDESKGSVHSDVPWVNHAIEKFRANPALAIYKLQSSAYKYSWALVPISVPFVALLFLWRRGYKMYDHSIFVIYSLSFMTLLVSLVTLLAAIGVSSNLYGWLIAFGPPVHMFVQLKGAYALGWFSALWRTVALLLFAGVSLLVFAALLLAMGLAG